MMRLTDNSEAGRLTQQEGRGITEKNAVGINEHDLIVITPT